MRRSGDSESRRNATSSGAATEEENRINILSFAANSFKVLRVNNQERTKTMHSILEEFAYGNISPLNQCFKRNSRYAEAVSAVSSNEKKRFRILDGEEKNLFQEYVNAQGEVNQLTAVKNLIYGYKLGVLMTAETFITSGDLVAGEGDC